MKYYVLEPEVAGGWGEGTTVTRKPGEPDIIHTFHYEFDGWLGDALLETNPCYIVTEQLANEIQKARLTGASFDVVRISKSDEFLDSHPDRDLPNFVWLKIEGRPCQDDFGIFEAMLVVSERALAVLRSVGIPHCMIEPFDGVNLPSMENELKRIYGP